MPLYRKAISFTAEDLEKMSLNECEEVLLALRYLSFREADSSAREMFAKRIKIVENRLLEIREKQNT